MRGRSSIAINVRQRSAILTVNMKGGLGDMDKLKPCPFCGDEDINISFYTNELTRPLPAGYMYECGSCGCEGPSFNVLGSYDAKARRDAKEAWNRRPDNG